MKTLFVGINLFLTLLAGIANREEATHLTVAQMAAEAKIQQVIEEDYNEIPEDIPYEISTEYNITWLDQDTGIIELNIRIDEDNIGFDEIFDIDEYGDYHGETIIRYYINNESFTEYNDDVWEDLVASLYPELME